MNKYFVIIIIAVVVLGGGVVYRKFLLPESAVPVRTGVVREITVVAKKDEWRFIPEDITVDRGDTVKLTVVNEDDYDHGIAIDAFGISQRMPANATIHVEFVATQAGDFPFYCSVPCGEGDANGEFRTHFDMLGKMHVADMVQKSN